MESISIDLNNIPISKVKYFNPFSTLLDMVQFYYGVAERNNLEELDCFIDAEYSRFGNSFPNLKDTEHIQNTIIKKTSDWLLGQTNHEWMNFDVKELNNLLDKPFFHEYRMRAKRFPSKYAFLELYTYCKLQSIAVSKLPRIRSEMVWYFFCYQDMIEYVLHCGFFTSISDIYKKWGWKWFIHTNEEEKCTDPFLYQWACYAIISCKKIHSIPINCLKKDLTDIYSELLILLVRSNSLKENSGYISFIKQEIQDFDNDEINSLKNQIKVAKHQNLKLLQDKKTIEKSYTILTQELKKIQKDSYRTDDEKVKGMLERIYLALYKNDDWRMDENNISKIWDRLSPLTQKNIKLAMDLFQLFKRADMASFLLISCLEIELNHNFFMPFKKSSSYQSIKDFKCNNKRYEIVHESLCKKDIYPTMGTIPFVGRAVDSPKANSASEIIKRFTDFLGKEKDSFCKICKEIDTYRIGLNQFSIINIRNGVAHGDVDIEQQCDQRCFTDIKNFLYNPPLQIMILIILHSKKSAFSDNM